MFSRLRLTTAGAVFAIAVSLFWSVGVRPALAGVDGDLVLDSFISNGSCTVGDTNCTSGSTGVTSHGGGLAWRADSGIGLYGISLNGDRGVVGYSQGTEGSGIGVAGTGPNVGVDGVGKVGLHGNGQGDGGQGVSAEGTSYGVYATGTAVGISGLGLTSDGVQGQAGDGANGVFGSNFGAGVGVRGESQSGPGVVAKSTSGVALRVAGRAQFSRSGRAVVAGTTAAPKSSVVISNVYLSSKSLVLATPQTNRIGVWVEAAVPNVSAKTITIYLNKAVPVSYPVAWFVIEAP
jgi:hypothetical protein